MPNLQLAWVGEQKGQGGKGRARRAPESTCLSDEEVIRLVWMSLSAAFIKCRSSRTARGPKRSSGTVGRRRGRAEGEREERGELLSRSGAGRGENYREENKPRAAEKEIRHEAGQARRRRGPRSGPGASIVFPQT